MNHTYEKCGCGEVHVSTRPETLRYVDGTGQLWRLHCFLRALEERLNKLDGAAGDRSLVDCLRCCGCPDDEDGDR